MRVLEEHTIVITESDRRRLARVIESQRGSIKADQHNLEMLAKELDRAKEVEASQVPRDVVTMNSRVQILDLDSGQVATYTLVFPEEADISRSRISILAPIGTAILGYRVGDVFEWQVPGGTRKLKVKKVMYQPETDRSSPSSDRPLDFPLDTGCKT